MGPPLGLPPYSEVAPDIRPWATAVESVAGVTMCYTKIDVPVGGFCGNPLTINELASGPPVALMYVTRRRRVDPGGVHSALPNTRSCALNKRASYRVVYPASERPRLVMDNLSTAAASVAECSEGGLSFEVPAAWPGMELGAEVCGHLEFHRLHCERWANEDAPYATRPAVPVTGEIVRMANGVVSIRLEWPGVPFGVLLREQFGLRARYPGWPAQESDMDRTTLWSLRLER